MFTSKNISSILLAFLFSVKALSQLGFSHELGVVAGPVAFQSDFGERNDFETNSGNTGFGVGIVHYINFSYRADCNCYTADNFFNDHVKLRTEISYNKTKLNHFGKWVDDKRQSEGAKQLRAHSGEANNLDFGVQMEIYIRSIRSFQAFGYRFNPYVSLGAHLTNYNPKVFTSYGTKRNDDPNNFFQAWYKSYPRVDPISDESGSTYSIVASTGVRYKMTMLSDLVIDLRWQYFGKDWLDGLNHNLESNKSNDWLTWLNIGYVYYLD